MEQEKSHGALGAVLVGVVATVVVQGIALSSFELVKEWVGSPLGIWAAGVTLGLVCLWAGWGIRGRLDEMLDGSGSPAGRPLLQAVLSRELPGSRYRRTLVGLGLVTLVLLCALHWVAHETWSFLVHSLHVPSWWILPGGSLAALALAGAWRRLERPELTVDKGEPGPLEALVLFLSSPGQAPLPHAMHKYGGGVKMSTADFLADFRDVMQTRLGRLPRDEGEVKLHFGKNSWAMPVWSIANAWKEKSLQHIVLVGSKGAGDFQGTVGLARSLKEVLAEAMGPGGPEIHIWPNGEAAEGIEFENFDELKRTLREIRGFLEGKLRGATHQRICVDVTGGTKLCTIVGLAAALEPGLATRYVSTSTLHVSDYDARYETRGVEPLVPEPSA